MRTHFGLTVIPALLCAAPAIAQDQFPEGAGKAATLQLCAGCHAPDIIVGHKQTRDEWTATIQAMMNRGLEASPEQLTSVLDYLTKHFGPGSAAETINVNKAPAVELEHGFALTAKEAEAIVKYRTEKGAFKTVDDLKKVPDLDFKKIEAHKDRVSF
jgi:competence ComEA-like helix-hairpin-helix protein